MESTLYYTRFVGSYARTQHLPSCSTQLFQKSFYFSRGRSGPDQLSYAEHLEAPMRHPFSTLDMNHRVPEEENMMGVANDASNGQFERGS